MTVSLDQCRAVIGTFNCGSLFTINSHNISLTESFIQFARIHTSSLINIEKILNRPITKFYNSDDVNVIAAELRLTKMRPTSFYKQHNLL